MRYNGLESAGVFTYCLNKLLSPKAAAQCKSTIKEFKFCGLGTTFKPTHGNGMGLQSNIQKFPLRLYISF